jgi:hypothetical protein
LAAVVSVGSPSASGAQESIRPQPTGYFTRTQDPLVTAGTTLGTVLCSLGVPDVCLDPSAIIGTSPVSVRADNYVYVARLVGTDDAVGVIGVPLFSLPFGSKVNSLSLEFHVDNMLDVGTFLFTPDNPGLQFCMATEGYAGEDGAAWDSQPTYDCAVQARPVKVSEEQLQETTGEGVPRVTTLVKYRVDLMPMARAWAAGKENNGVVVRPAQDAPNSFEAAIRPAANNRMVINVNYDAPPPLAVPAAPAFNTTQPAAQTSFGGTEGPAETPPPFTVAEPQTDTTPAKAKSGTPWWVYLALPIGLAVLAAMSRGVAEPITVDHAARRGPVGRLMERGRDT